MNKHHLVVAVILLAHPHWATAVERSTPACRSLIDAPTTTAQKRAHFKALLSSAKKQLIVDKVTGTTSIETEPLVASASQIAAYLQSGSVEYTEEVLNLAELLIARDLVEPAGELSKIAFEKSDTRTSQRKRALLVLFEVRWHQNPALVLEAMVRTLEKDTSPAVISKALTLTSKTLYAALDKPRLKQLLPQLSAISKRITSLPVRGTPPEVDFTRTRQAWDYDLLDKLGEVISFCHLHSPPPPFAWAYTYFGEKAIPPGPRRAEFFIRILSNEANWHWAAKKAEEQIHQLEDPRLRKQLMRTLNAKLQKLSGA